MKKILKTIIPVSLLLLGTIIPATVFALDIDTSYAPLTDIPGLKDATASNPGGMLKTIFNLSIGIGGILAVIMIIVAGFKYMYEESIFGKSKAKEQITNAFFGLLLILGSFIILKTINSDLLRINFLLPKGDGGIGDLVAEKNNVYSSIIVGFTNAANKQIAELEKARAAEAAATKAREDSEKKLAELVKSGKGTSDEAKALQVKIETDKKNELLAKQTTAIENQGRLVDQGLATSLKWLGTQSGGITAEEKTSNVSQMIATTNSQFDKSIETLTTTGVDTKTIESAKKEKEFFNVVAGQSIENEKGLAVAASYISRDSKNSALNVLVTRRENMIKNINETVASTRTLSPELADSFSEKGQDLIKVFDTRVSETMFPGKKCSSIRYHSDKTIECIP